MKLATLSFALTTILSATALSACVGAEADIDELTAPNEVFIVEGIQRVNGDCPSSPAGWSTREVYPLASVSVGTRLLNTNEVFANSELGTENPRKPEALVAAVLLNLETGDYVSDDVLEATTELDEWIVSVEIGDNAPSPTGAIGTIREYFSSLRPCVGDVDVAVEQTYEAQASVHPPQDQFDCSDSTEGCPTIFE